MVSIVYPDINMFSNGSFIIIVIIIVLLQLRERRVKLWTLMIMPAFMLFITSFIVQSVFFTSILNFSLITAGFIVGVLIGIALGSLMAVKVDEDGTMILKGSFIAVILWVLVIILKFYGQNVLGTSGYFDLSVLTSVLLMMTLGAMISRRIFIYRRYRNYKINNCTDN